MPIVVGIDTASLNGTLSLCSDLQRRLGKGLLQQYWSSVCKGGYVHRSSRGVVRGALFLTLAVGVAQGQGASYATATFCTSTAETDLHLVKVSNGSELQAALDAAAAGDVILLDPGATFRSSAHEGSFLLRRRPFPPGTSVILRSADKSFDADGASPPSVRVDKTNAPVMAKVRATGNSPAIRAESGAHGYRLVGIDVGADPSVANVITLIELGSGRDTAIDTEPSDIVIDRCYLHGNDTGNFRRGIAMNGVRLAVVDSYLENFHDANGDSQAIAGWNGPGPFQVLNNYPEAASENVMFGGADPAVHELVPADIEIRRNLMTKRASWRTQGVPVKNAFELKNARRVVITGNTFEHVWASGQDGTAIVLKSVNQEGRCAWCVTEYVTFSDNVVRDAGNGVMINAAEVGGGGFKEPVHANHIRIRNVLFQNIGAAEWSGGGKLFRIMGGVSDVVITHVTSGSNPNGILDPRDSRDINPGLTFQYNAVERKLYGIGTGGDEGATTLTRNFAPFTYGDNVFVNTSTGTDQALTDDALKGRYPKTTVVVSAWAKLGYRDGPYTPPSRGSSRPANGELPGVDFETLQRAQDAPETVSCGPSPANAGRPH